MRSPRCTGAVVLVATMLWLAPGVEAACTAAPRTDCRRPAVASKSSLRFKQTGNTDPDDIYSWQWLFGSATALADFGAPEATDDYSLCIYDQSSRPQPVVENHAAAGAGWIAKNDTFLFHMRSNRPLRRLRLKAGLDGQAKILAAGDSDTVRPILPFEAPVVVQLQTSAGHCWETIFATPRRNSVQRFGARD
jgi:hypothetical protein